MSIAPTVTVYTKPACVQCTATCTALDRQAVAFQLSTSAPTPRPATT